MSRKNDTDQDKLDEFFHESDDDPYAIPSEDIYDTPDPSNNNDTQSNLSKFLEDKWTGDDESKYDGKDFDKIDIENGQKQKHIPAPKKSNKDLTLELGTAGICSILFLRNYVEGGLVGFVFGGIKGVIGGYQTGGNKLPGFARSVRAEAAANGRSLGLWLGTYRASKVLFSRTRGVEDHLNTFMAGFCAGSAYMLHTRSPLQIISSGLSSGAMLTVLGAYGGSNW